MAYYVMIGEGEHPIRPIRRGPDLSGNWRDGALVSDPVPNPLIYTLAQGRAGEPKAMYYAEAIPVMRNDLAGVLTDAGVDNIQYFGAVLIDPDNGRRHENYKAYNVVGLVSCADLGLSELMGTSDSDLIDMDFDRLVIDESRTGGALLFRLAENVSAIVVSQQVKDAVEASGIPGIVFYESGEWSG